MIFLRFFLSFLPRHSLLFLFSEKNREERERRIFNENKQLFKVPNFLFLFRLLSLFLFLFIFILQGRLSLLNFLFGLKSLARRNREGRERRGERQTLLRYLESGRARSLYYTQSSFYEEIFNLLRRRVDWTRRHRAYEFCRSRQCGVNRRDSIRLTK